MDNIQAEENTTSKSSSWITTGIIISAVLVILIYFLFNKEEPAPIDIIAPPEPVVIEEVIPLPEPVVEEIAEPEVVVEEIVIEEPEVSPLPALNESDTWVQTQLEALTWRKELLKLIINEDMIRRFVVFTNNFSQGLVAYKHSPFIRPVGNFSVQNIKSTDGESVLLWDESSYKRFSVYVELIRSLDTETLVQWYIELKPLIDEAYAELGYEDEDFTEVLKSAMVKVLDMELPKDPIELDRPSVMYKYKSESLEELDDSEKLLLRIGKENLLVIKSVLLEMNEKLTRNTSP